MRSLVKLNNDKKPMCCICIYSDEENSKDDLIYCIKKQRHFPQDNKCRKFELDITAISARRKRSPKLHSPEEFSID